MRNLSDEQVQEIANDIVRDHLMKGVEFIDVVETVDEFTDNPELDYEDGVEEATDEDYRAVDSRVDEKLELLIEALVDRYMD